MSRNPARAHYPEREETFGAAACPIRLVGEAAPPDEIEAEARRRLDRLKVQTIQLRRAPPARKLLSAVDVADLLRSTLPGSDRERFVALLLDVRNRVIGVDEVAVGSLSGVEVHPREVFKAAILANAAAVLFVHNHPSGDPEPSAQDIELTRRLGEAGNILGISVLDHIVIGEGGRFVSLRERGLL